MRQEVKHMGQAELFFADHPVFTLEQFAATVGAKVSTDVTYRHLAYYARTGRVKRLRNALWAVVPLGVDAGTHTPDPYLVAAAAGRGAPLGYHTALELLGVAQSVFRTKTVVSDRRSSSFVFGDYQVEFVRPPAALAKPGGEDLGVGFVEYAGARLRATGRERTLVDCLTQPLRAGGLEEVLNSVLGFGVLDLDALEAYLRILNIRRAWAVTAFFLETQQERLFIPDQLLLRWEAEGPRSARSPHYWLRGQRGGTLAKRWNLVVPDLAGAILGH
jgi:predicted transcriptional regulator of viral defense system